MPTPASGVKAEAGAKPPVIESFVTLVVTDEEGRRFTRTMRTTDQLQILKDFYYDMVPTVKRGEGLFYHGWNRQIASRLTPADYRMKDGDKIKFFPPIDLVTPVLQDFTGCSFTRTMRKTDRMQDLMGFYTGMVPAVGLGIFMYRGERVTGEQTPAALGMKDWDRIYVVPRLSGKVDHAQGPDSYITLRVRGGGIGDVYRTMRRTEKVKVLMDFYKQIMPVAKCSGVFIFESRRLWELEKRTPADLEMDDDGGVLDFCLQY